MKTLYSEGICIICLRILPTLKILIPIFQNQFQERLKLKKEFSGTIKKIEDYIKQEINFISQTAQTSFEKIGQIKKIEF